MPYFGFGACQVITQRNAKNHRENLRDEKPVVAY